MNCPFAELLPLAVETLSVANWNRFKILAAVSGGPDSVAMLRILDELRKQYQLDHDSLIVAHINHQTRGSHSDQDEQFVRELAISLSLQYQTVRLPTLTSAPPEEQLRDLRYQALLQIANQTGTRYLATGHTFDDQVETILFRLFRGTGLNGLSGIPPIRVSNQTVSIIRPLLSIRRSQLETLLKQLGQSYQTDSSNTDSKYTRNFLRHDLLPQLRARFGPAIDDSIHRISEQASDTCNYLNQHARQALAAAIKTQTPDRLELQTSILKKSSPLIIRQFLICCWEESGWPRQAMTYHWWAKIADTIVSAPQPPIVLNLPANIRLETGSTQTIFTYQK